ncbi:MAG: 50S ribosomal protein L11 methyltransferase [Actinobacteria bacterium]|nr:50S ribosomal protein L11 methyltransferase [Actinomycetota bacterium]
MNSTADLHPPADHTPYRWTGAGGPFTLLLSPEVFTPSSTSRVLADTIRVAPGDTALDLGCGCGVLSFAALNLGAGRVIGSDISTASIRCALDNADRLGVTDRAEFRIGHLLDAVRDERADVIIADVSGVPDALAAATGWFPDGRGGGPSGAELPSAMLSGIDELLTPTGRVYLPTATLQAEEAVLDAAHAVFGDRMSEVARREFPLPQSVTDAPEVAKLVDTGMLQLTRRGSRLTWRLSVWECRRQ